MSGGLLVFGSALLGIGLLLIPWPAPIYWLDEQLNIRWARWWSEHVHEVGPEHRLRRPVLRWAAVGFFLLFGTLLVLDAVFDLQRGD